MSTIPAHRTDPILRALKLKDLEALFEEYKDHPMTSVLNDSDYNDADYAEKISELVLSRANDVDFISSCACGHFSGNFYDGEICPKCDTVVVNEMTTTGGSYPTRTWVRAPKQLEHGWMHPTAYMWLERWTSYGGKNTKDRAKIRSYIGDLIDPSKPLPDFMRPWVEEHQQATGTPRGFGLLYETFERFIHSMIHEAPANVTKKASTNNTLKALILYKDKLWVRHFPIMFNSLHAIINGEGSVTNKRRYVDSTVKHIFHAASALSYLEYQTGSRTMSDRRIHTEISKIYQSMISYYNSTTHKHINGKYGLPRKHVFGARHHLSVRALISPIASAHKLDDVHLSWETGVNLFRPHIMGRLMHEFGLTPSEAFNKHHAALQTYDKDIDKLIKRFIKESPFRGVPVLVCRNPSVSYLSVQLMYLTQVKTDVADRTMSLSSRILSGFNGDYDGDEMNLLLLPETESIEAWKDLHGSVNFMDRNQPSVTKHFGIMKNDLLSLNGFLQNF